LTELRRELNSVATGRAVWKGILSPVNQKHPGMSSNDSGDQSLFILNPESLCFCHVTIMKRTAFEDCGHLRSVEYCCNALQLQTLLFPIIIHRIVATTTCPG